VGKAIYSVFAARGPIAIGEWEMNVKNQAKFKD
jgi:hypothetical protein